MKCPNCGAEIANDSVFCEICGTQIAKPKKSRKAIWISLVVLILIGAIGGIVYYQNEIQKEKIAEAERKAGIERLAREEAEQRANESEMAKQKAESDREKAEKRAKEAEKKNKQIEVSSEWIDLGLPSGILWKKENEGGLYNQSDAIRRFGNHMPSIYDFQELKKYCTWSIDGRRYKVTGPNGKCIYMTAEGNGESFYAYREGNYGAYWSSTTQSDNHDTGLGFYIDDDYIFLWHYEPTETLSVRLIKRKK